MGDAILLAGGGKMGSALLAGWMERGVNAGDVTVVEPDQETAKKVSERFGVTVVTEPGGTGDAAPGAVVLAVKPQSMDAAISVYTGFAGGETVFLTIAAGKTIAYFEDQLGPDAAIVRAMPNTPAAVGRGITVACANANTGDSQLQLCDALLQAVGVVAWVDDEGLMDAVTAVSGSGPAYVFLLAECMAEAGIEVGLPAELAAELALATVAGAGGLFHQSGEAAATLRANVTSPGGTTAAALDILMADDGLRPLIAKAVTAAAKRSKKLAG